MPELPEVETVVRGLREPLVGYASGVRFGKTDFIDDPIACSASASPGSKIARVERLGKFISLDDAAAGIRAK